MAKQQKTLPAAESWRQAVAAYVRIPPRDKDIDQFRFPKLVCMTPGESEEYLKNPDMQVATERPLLKRLGCELEELKLTHRKDHWAFDEMVTLRHYFYDTNWRDREVRPLLREYLEEPLRSADLDVILNRMPELVRSADLDVILNRMPELVVALVLKRAAEEADYPQMARHYYQTVKGMLFDARTSGDKSLAEILGRAYPFPERERDPSRSPAVRKARAIH